MRFAMYGRKSIYSDKSDSIDNQQRMCKEYIDFRFHGKIDSFETYSDEGLTGANTNRPALRQLLEDVENGFIDALIVYQLDRLSRNVKDFANIYSILEEKGVMFISIKENIDTDTPIGKAMMYVTMVFAQMERETIAARVSDNMIGLAQKGFWTGGKPPQGYTLKQIEINNKKHVILELNPESAEYCKWIFNKFLENNYTISKMQTEFRENGVLTKGGAFFSTAQIHRILTMPYCVEATPEVYDYFAKKGCQMDINSPREKWDGKKGVMVYGRINHKGIQQPKDTWIVCLGHQKPFISANEWLAIQEKLHRNTFGKKMKYNVPLLKGVIRCAKCGWLMAVNRKKSKSNIFSYYICRKRSQQGVNGCDMTAKSCADLDKLVLDIFKNIEANPKTIFQYANTVQPQDEKSKLRDLESKSKQLQIKISRLTEALAAAEASTATKYIITQIEKEDLNLEATKREIEIIKTGIRRNQNKIKTAEERAEQIAHLIQEFDVFTDIERNEIVREIVQECTWDGETLFLRL